MAKKIDKLCEEAAKVLIDAGVGTFTISAKCPDSEEFGINKAGNKVYLLGLLNTTKIVVQAELFKMNSRPKQ